MSKKKVSTNRKTRFSLKRSLVDVLRLDRYFFSKNSALPFPVKLPDSAGADKTANAALDTLGIKSFAVVFKHIADDDNLRIVVAGHADSSDAGPAADRFALSGLRAKAVSALLAGKSADWAAAIFAKHSIEDYKLLLKYFNLNKKRYFAAYADKVKVLDPGKVDGNWNDDTDKAVRNLVVGYNEYAKTKKLESLKLSVVMKKIKDDGAKRWPEEMWKIVLALYENALMDELGLKTRKELEARRKKLILFCDDEHPFVSCGESVPLKGLGDEKKSGYEPEPGRGAEILFFSRKSVPGKEIKKKMRIICHDDSSSAHKAADCPIFYKHHMKATYIDHRNLDLVLYHVKFVYYDRIKKDIAFVPVGLALKAYHYHPTTKKKEALDAVVDFNDGVYTVKVPDDKKRKNIQFEFTTADPAAPAKRLWVFTGGAGADPVLAVKTDAEINALAAADRLKYYDLPKEWSSENYWTRFGKYTVGDLYLKMMKKKGFKPYGSGQMTASSPLIFSLDDIVLTDGTGAQNIRDKKEDDSAVDLSKHSRVALLYADAADDMKIKMHKPIEKEPYFSDIEGGFKANLIHDYWYGTDGNLHSPCRAVVFCSDFYDIYGRRTESYADFKFSKGHVLGARAARRDDPGCSAKKSCNGWNAVDIASVYVCNGAGNYTLHYLHDWGIGGNKIHGGLILYWSCRFKVDLAKGGKNADRRNYIEKGLKNAMDRIALKGYQYEKLSGPKDIIIKTFPLFEAKQDYGRSLKRGGAHICMVSLVDDSNTSSMGETTGTFRSGSYKEEPNRFVVNDPNNNVQDYDGRTFDPMTSAHEIGHALGLDDEYIRTKDSKVGLAQYDQYYPGVPYSKDLLSLMNKNRGTRMHQFWLYANWLNDASAVGGALNGILDGTKFQLALRGGGFAALLFELTDPAYKNIYKPVYEADVNYGGGCNGYLIVYKLGDGEFANTLKTGKKYTGIMVIRTNIRVSYANDTGNWTGQEMVDWIQALDSDLKIMLNDKFRLECTTAGQKFSNVFMYFLPHYSTDSPAPAGTHFRLRVKKNGNAAFTPDAADKSKIEVDDQVDNNKIIRHFFGKFAGTSNLTAAELSKIKDWMGDAGRANDAFTIEAL